MSSQQAATRGAVRGFSTLQLAELAVNLSKVSLRATGQWPKVMRDRKDPTTKQKYKEEVFETEGVMTVAILKQLTGIDLGDAVAGKGDGTGGSVIARLSHGTDDVDALPFKNGGKSYEMRRLDNITNAGAAKVALQLMAARPILLAAVRGILGLQSLPGGPTRGPGAPPVSFREVLESGQFFGKVVGSNDLSKGGSALDTPLVTSYSWGPGKESLRTPAQRTAAIYEVLAQTTDAEPDKAKRGGVGAEREASAADVNERVQQSTGLLALKVVDDIILKLARADKSNAADQTPQQAASRQRIAPRLLAALTSALTVKPRSDSPKELRAAAMASGLLQTVMRTDPEDQSIPAWPVTVAEPRTAFTIMNAAQQASGGLVPFSEDVWLSMTKSTLSALLAGIKVAKPGKEKDRGFKYDPAQFPTQSYLVQQGNGIAIRDLEPSANAYQFTRYVFDNLFWKYMNSNGSADVLPSDTKASSGRRQTSGSGFAGATDDSVKVLSNKKPSDIATFARKVRTKAYSEAGLRAGARNLGIVVPTVVARRNVLEETILDALLINHRDEAAQGNAGALNIMTAVLAIDGFTDIEKTPALVPSAVVAVRAKLDAHYGRLDMDCGIALKNGWLRTKDLKIVAKNKGVLVKVDDKAEDICGKLGAPEQALPLNSGQRAEAILEGPAKSSGRRSGTRASALPTGFIIPGVASGQQFAQQQQTFVAPQPFVAPSRISTTIAPSRQQQTFAAPSAAQPAPTLVAPSRISGQLSPRTQQLQMTQQQGPAAAPTRVSSGTTRTSGGATFAQPPPISSSAQGTLATLLGRK